MPTNLQPQQQQTLNRSDAASKSPSNEGQGTRPPARLKSLDDYPPPTIEEIRRGLGSV